MLIFPLYIDPGTGSALFAILIGIAAAAYFGFQALFIKAKVLFSGGRIKIGTKSKYVIYAEDSRYWTLFKPIVEEFEKRGIDLLYLTSSKDDPVFNYGYKHINIEFIGEGNKAFARLNFLSADLVLATTPGLDVYQWKRSKSVKHYSHILHSSSESSTYKLFGIDYFDSILTTGGDHQIKDIRRLENIRSLPEKKIVTVGCTYLDEYAEKIKKIEKEDKYSFTVLVSPSWGTSSLLVRYGEKLLDPLLETGWNIIVRPHPQSLLVEKDIIDRLSKKYDSYSNFEWDFNKDNILSISKTDIMISDFSGIILDYMFLRNKPVIYVSEKMDLRPYDTHLLYDNHEEMWTFKMLKKVGIELKPEMFANLADIIKNVSAEKYFESEIERIKTEAWNYQGEAGKRVADFMLETVEGF